MAVPCRRGGPALPPSPGSAESSVSSHRNDAAPGNVGSAPALLSANAARACESSSSASAAVLAVEEHAEGRYVPSARE